VGEWGDGERVRGGLGGRERESRRMKEGKYREKRGNGGRRGRGGQRENRGGGVKEKGDRG